MNDENVIKSLRKKTPLEKLKASIESNPVAFAITGLGKLLHEELPAWRRSVDELSGAVKELAKEMKKKKDL